MQNSTNQQDPDRDQSGVGDSAGMTIEFLRARLLSERSVSRTARQRADELGKKVVELEEQLKIVSLQRKNAERATSNVLTILENHGICEFSEGFDSSSDQEVTNCESKVGNNFPNEEESSVNSKMSRNHMDEFSGSEVESSRLPGRSLSWRSGKDSRHTHKMKYVDSSTRRQRTFAYTTSASPRCRVGKSCRQIRRRETRSAVEESQMDSSMISCQDNGATCSEGSTFSDIGPEILRESPEKRDAKIVLEVPVSGDFKNQRPVTNASNYLNIHGSDKDMERALEHQAELIGQYEEEEKAQREWEEKFRENNNSTPDSCEPGNRSDVTEERDETKVHTPPHPATTIVFQDQDPKLKVEDVSAIKESSKSQSDGFQSPPHVDMGCLHNQTSSNVLGYESPASDFVFPVANGKQDRQHSGNYNVLPSHGYHPSSCLESPASNQLAHVVPSHAGSSLFKEDTLGSNNKHYALVTHETPNKLGSVLEALHHAKLSLKHKLNTLASIDSGSVKKAIEFSVGDSLKVPVGCAGLFRVPSDFHLEATTKANILGSNSQLSLTNYYPDAGTALTASDRFITSPYTESRSSVSTGNGHLTIPTGLHMESKSKVPTWEPLETQSKFSSHKPLFGPSLDMGLTFPGRYIYNDVNKGTVLASSSAYTSPAYPLYPDLMPRMPTDEGLRLSSSGRVGVPPADHYSFYGDHIRPNMYRI